VSFYTQCGGIDLFANKPFGISLVSPSEFVKANPVIARVDGEGDISFDWFIVAKAGEQYVTMDLNPTRLGQCYDSFWDRHAVAGSCPVIAKSYAELLAQLLNGRGENWFWLAPDFQGYGDAYDAISH